MHLPVGKLPHELLTSLLTKLPVIDPRVLLGPGVGLDCAVIDFGDTLLVLKTDPITFATEEIGWYAVQINANDIATSGAEPRWFLATLLLPNQSSTAELVEAIFQQVFEACQQISVSWIGGHTEITYGLNRPILVGTMIGEVPRGCLVTPRGASPGDHILLTKGVPIEATAILAKEFPEKLSAVLTSEEIEQARQYLYDPGISVIRDASLATQAGMVSAMHDPTEGGLAGALWELAEACSRRLIIDVSAVPVPELSARICHSLGLNPLAAIASGALLLTAPPDSAPQILQALVSEGIPCVEIGVVEDGPISVWSQTEIGTELLPRPAQDEIARLFINSDSQKVNEF